MKTIGIIGGMSWESTSEYYRLINEGVRARLGGLHSAKIALISVDFAAIEPLQQAGAWDETARLLAEAGRQAAPERTFCCWRPTPCTRSRMKSKPGRASRCCTSPTPQPGRCRPPE
ncbi:MAG TPA: hypothetical protein VFF68_00095 [Anaerolineaceae bacterium]|nr:hypothetical protein [Anaerolineaceae bacterium]